MSIETEAKATYRLLCFFVLKCSSLTATLAKNRLHLPNKQHLLLKTNQNIREKNKKNELEMKLNSSASLSLNHKKKTKK